MKLKFNKYIKITFLTMLFFQTFIYSGSNEIDYDLGDLFKEAPNNTKNNNIKNKSKKVNTNKNKKNEQKENQKQNRGSLRKRNSQNQGRGRRQRSSSIDRKKEEKGLTTAEAISLGFQGINTGIKAYSDISDIRNRNAEAKTRRTQRSRISSLDDLDVKSGNNNPNYDNEMPEEEDIY
jgi:hypothetical protein